MTNFCIGILAGICFVKSPGSWYGLPYGFPPPVTCSKKNSICRHGSPSTFCSYTPFSYKVYALKLWFFGEKKLFRFIFLNNLQSASSRQIPVSVK